MYLDRNDLISFIRLQYTKKTTNNTLKDIYYNIINVNIRFIAPKL